MKRGGVKPGCTLASHPVPSKGFRWPSGRVQCGAAIYAAEGKFAGTIIAVRTLDLRQCEQLSDEIHANQPQFLLSVLALRSFGVSPEQLEVPLNTLLVCYQCMKTCGRQWPLISEAMQERCIMRLVARMRFNDGLAPAQAAEAITTYIAEHNVRWLLAFVFGELGSNNALSLESEVQKHLVLVTLALVECIA